MKFVSPQNWFAAQLKPNGLKLALAHLHRQSFGTFVPMMPAPPKLRQKRTTKPVFPGYVFVTFDHSDRSWARINATRGVTRVIASDPLKPQPLPSEFMQALMERCGPDGTLLPPKHLKVGETIKVVSGPFVDTVARIFELPDQDRVAILIELMGRSVRTTIPTASVARVDAT